MDVLTTLTTSGALPLSQLNLLTRGTPVELRGELERLIKRKFVKISGEILPEADAIPTAEATVTLTRAGLQESLG